MTDTTAKQPGNSWLGWTILAVCLAAAYLLIRQRFENGSTTAGSAQALYSWKAVEVDGKTADLAALKGKVVFLNVWATWCPPCREEMPSIARLARNSRLKDVAFVCVSVDSDDDAVRNYVKTNDMPMRVVISRMSPPAPFETEGIPATFIISADGEVVYKQVGSRDWSTPQVVDRLLNAGAKAGS